MSYYYYYDPDELPTCPVCKGTEYGPFDFGRPGAPYDAATSSMDCWVCLTCGYSTFGDPRSNIAVEPDCLARVLAVPDA